MQQHALTTLPGQIIGYVNGRPVRTIAGGSAPVGDPAAPPAAVPAAPAAPQVVPAAPPAAPAAPAFEWDGKIESLPEPVQKIITDARADAGKARTTAKEQAAAEARQQLLKDLGLVKDDEPGDPAELKQQLAGKDSTIVELRRDNALIVALHTTGAKPLARAAILGDGVLKDLDITAADYAKQVEAKVTEYLTKYPELKGGQAPPPASGIPGTGGPGPTADIDAQIDAATKAGNHRLAISLKRQKAYAPQA